MKTKFPRYDLTVEEAVEVGSHGLKRNAFAMTSGLKHSWGKDGDFRGWGTHVIGAHGEYVGSKHCKTPWDPTVGKITSKDIGVDIEVKASWGENLNIAEDEKFDPSSLYMYVRAIRVPKKIRYEIMGGMYGFDIAAGDYHVPKEKSPHGNPYYSVPMGDLTPINEFDEVKKLREGEDPEAWIDEGAP